MDVNKKGPYQKPDETLDAIADKEWRQEHGISTIDELLDDLEDTLKEDGVNRSKSDT
jgi:hypothetical protein